MKKCAILLLLFPVWAIGSWADDSLNVRTVGSWPYSFSWAVAKASLYGHDYLLAGFGSGIFLYNVDNPVTPKRISELAFPGSMVRKIDVQDTFAYIAAMEGGLRVVNISDTLNMMETGYCLFPRPAYGVKAAGNYVCVAAESCGLRIVDVANPYNPWETGFYDTPGNAQNVEAKDTLAFVADGDSGLRIISFGNPAIPMEISSFDSIGVGDLALRGRYAYTASGSIGVLDISDPANPIMVGSGGSAQYIIDIDDTIALGNGSGGAWGPYTEINSIADSINPAWLKTYVNYAADFRGACFSAGYAFTAQNIYGLSVLDISDPVNPLEKYNLGIQVWSVDTVADSMLYANCPDLYILDVSNPVAPKMAGFCENGLTNNVSTAIDGNIAYVLGVYGPLFSVDITDRNNPIFLDTLQFSGSTWKVVLKDTLALVANGESGLQIVNVADPSNMVIIGHAPGRYGDIAIKDNYVFLAGESLTVVDISEPQNPAILYRGAPGGGFHLLGNYLYAAMNGLHILDVNTPQDPVEIGFCPFTGTAIEVSVTGDVAYVSTLDSGLIAVDVSDPTNPKVGGRYRKYDPYNNIYEEHTAKVITFDGKAYVCYDCYGIQIYEYYGPIGVEEKPAAQSAKQKFRLCQNCPNPFNNKTTINYQLPETQKVSLIVYNVAGQAVRTLYQGVQKPGQYSLTWNGRDGRGRAVSAGVYFLRLSSPGGQATKKMVVAK